MGKEKSQGPYLALGPVILHRFFAMPAARGLATVRFVEDREYLTRRARARVRAVLRDFSLRSFRGAGLLRVWTTLAVATMPGPGDLLLERVRAMGELAVG